mmetsp:Transcript_20696/g.55373  ORF Transcript_20696/g.55373 Transcript_20696/m.55373 type:complete len:291 (+) Transcript_20696:559-1431(+)
MTTHRRVPIVPVPLPGKCCRLCCRRHGGGVCNARGDGQGWCLNLGHTDPCLRLVTGANLGKGCFPRLRHGGGGWPAAVGHAQAEVRRARKPREELPHQLPIFGCIVREVRVDAAVTARHGGNALAAPAVRHARQAAHPVEGGPIDRSGGVHTTAAVADRPTLQDLACLHIVPAIVCGSVVARDRAISVSMDVHNWQWHFGDLDEADVETTCHRRDGRHSVRQADTYLVSGHASVGLARDVLPRHIDAELALRKVQQLRQKARRLGSDACRRHVWDTRRPLALRLVVAPPS